MERFIPLANIEMFERASAFSLKDSDVNIYKKKVKFKFLFYVVKIVVICF